MESRCAVDDRTWVTCQGAHFSLRQIQKEDLSRLQRFVAGLSPQTGYQRLLSPRYPTEDELRRWVMVDPRVEAAVVAVDTTDEDHLAGVARYVVGKEHRVADMAIVVGDAWQGSGLGRVLLSHLIQIAAASGVHKLEGTTFSDNGAMKALAQRLGFTLQRDPASAQFTHLALTISGEPTLPRQAR